MSAVTAQETSLLLQEKRMKHVQKDGQDKQTMISKFVKNWRRSLKVDGSVQDETPETRLPESPYDWDTRGHP